MTGEFPPSGAGRPTDDQVKEARDYLLRHNRNGSVRSTHAELMANGFTLSIPTVARALKGTGKPPPSKVASPIAKAEHRVTNRRVVEGRVKGNKAEEAKIGLADLILPPDTVKEIVTMAALLSTENSSTVLAIRENRSRMALNIVLMEHMAARPELLLLDMRGTGLLVDALTVAAKLSGGASMDVTVPNQAAVDAVALENPSPGGHPMRDITPVKGPLSDEIAAFRAKRDAVSAKRA